MNTPPRLESRNIRPISAGLCLFINLALTPGLGSLLTRRFIAGTGQLLLALIGCAMVLVWFFGVMRAFYGQISGDVTAQPVAWIGKAGGIILLISWCWALLTSLSVLREEKLQREQAALESIPGKK